MYLVVYKNKKEYRKDDFFGLMHAGLTSRFEHCELAFERDGFFDAMVVSSLTPEGYPYWRTERQYYDHDGKFDICFYRFLNIDFKKLSDLKFKCHQISTQRTSRMSLKKMTGTALPKQLLFLVDYYLKVVMGYEFDTTEYDFTKVKPTYCVDTIRDVFDGIMDYTWPLDLTSGDLLMFLTQEKKITFDLNEQKKIKEDIKHVDQEVFDAEQGVVDTTGTTETTKKSKMTIKELFVRSFNFTENDYVV